MSAIYAAGIIFLHFFRFSFFNIFFQQAAKRRRKCPKCGKYAASSSPSEQSTSETTETGTAGNTESEDSVKNNQDYTGDSSGYSYSTETSISDSKGAESDGVNYDAAKSEYFF